MAVPYAVVFLPGRDKDVSVLRELSSTVIVPLFA